MSQNDQITEVLRAWEAGEKGAVDRLLPLVYDELRRLARGQLYRCGHGNRTLDTTALVHEAYLKFVDQGQLRLSGRQHFYAVAARAMRQILVDRARRRAAAKRGGTEHAVSLEEHDRMLETEAETMLALDEALDRLESDNQRWPRVVECRFFAGLTDEETAEFLGVSARTVQRDWRSARGRLRQLLSAEVVERLSSDPEVEGPEREGRSR